MRLRCGTARARVWVRRPVTLALAEGSSRRWRLTPPVEWPASRFVTRGGPFAFYRARLVLWRHVVVCRYGSLEGSSAAFAIGGSWGRFVYFVPVLQGEVGRFRCVPVA